MFLALLPSRYEDFKTFRNKNITSFDDAGDATGFGFWKYLCVWNYGFIPLNGIVFNNTLK